MPTPVSSTVTVTQPASEATRTVKVPPVRIASSALTTRLMITCLSFSRSPMATQPSGAMSRSMRTPTPSAVVALEVEHVVDQLRDVHRLARDASRARELEELREEPVQAPDLVADDLASLVQRRRASGRRASSLPMFRVEEVELEHRRVERVADLVREVQRERAHRAQRLGVGGALLEQRAARSRRCRCRRRGPSLPRSAWSCVADERCHRTRRELASRPRRLGRAVRDEPGLDLARARPRARLRDCLASAARSPSGIQLLEEAPADRLPRVRAARAALALRLNRATRVVRVERDDEHVGQLDDGAVPPLELLALALQRAPW